MRRDRLLATRPTRSPLDTAGLVFHLDAFSLGLADGAAVTTWTDLGPSAFAFTQGTASQRPTFDEDGINGRPAVSFDGGDLLRVADTVSTATGGTVIALVKRTSTAGFLLASANESSTSAFVGVGFGSSRLLCDQRNGDTEDVVRSSTDVPGGAGTTHVLSYTADDVLYEMYVDGLGQNKLLVGGSDAGDWFGGTAGRTSTVIGALKRTTESAFFTGWLGGMSMFNRVLTHQERLCVERWFADRWKVPTQ